MDLYVRSQNKDVLIKVNELVVESTEAGNKWFISNYKLDLESKTYLGTYKTKQRCIEILDEIQETMELHKDFVIYEMPQN
jgi:hypothetical protein